jgi:hypothetical protein
MTDLKKMSQSTMYLLTIIILILEINKLEEHVPWLLEEIVRLYT